MRHDLVWTHNTLPYVVTSQRDVKAGFLSVAQCLTPEKTTNSRIALILKTTSIMRHSKPIPLSVLLEDKLLREVIIVNKVEEKYRLINQLCDQLIERQLELRIFGSCSWQYFTKQAFINPQSDIDALLYIQEIKQLEGLAEKLAYLETLLGRKVDGELVFANNYFVAWREWFNTSKDILVKTNQQAYLTTKQEFLKQCMI